ncbi:MAG TPA: sigma-54 dependent transcriptional regulator [Myxococcota bacterium]|nr:sigma-54 dependent transcriptional regulator [Myxococcota bacterium]
MSVARPLRRGAGSRVLVVDDAEGIRTYLANLLEVHGYQVDTAEDGRRALALLEGGAAPDVVLMDVMMPGLGGIETLRRMREIDPSVPVVVLSVVGKASTIVEAMRLGAVDYLNKPFEEEELEATLRSVLERRELERERERLLAELDEGSRGAVWHGAAMQRVRQLVDQVAPVNVTVLIQGESGVGKELVAHALHEGSPRAKHAFVKVNCAALPEDLLESELFGYERGAFTGAVSRKPGKFEVADQGTMFLDEIGEMSPALQAKLLQVLQDATFSHLGGNREIRVDVRVVCATHRPLVRMVAAGHFREDLYHRLDVVDIQIPPLRERRDEIPPLVETFLRRFAMKYGRPLRQPSVALMRALDRYPFPGNIRELENMMKRVVVLESEEPVLAELLSGDRARRGPSRLAGLIDELAESAGQVPLKEVGRLVALEAEKEAIDRVLARTQWNRKKAAGLLGVSYKTLLQKIRECGLEEI